MTEWIKCSEKLPEEHCICIAKRKNGNIVKTYFHKDEMAWVKFYGVKTSHFQDKQTCEFLFDVEEWAE